jgi:hypothetical protein
MSAARIGTHPSPETRERMSAAKRGKPGRKLSPEEIEALRQRNRDRVISPETREKMRLAKLGKPGPWRGKKRGPHTEEWNSKIGARHRGIPKSLETREKIRVTLTGQAWTEERLRNMRTAAKSPERRARLSLALSGRKLSPEHVAKVSARMMGKPAQYPKHWSYYDGLAFRSSWEVRAARAMDALGVRWEYESRRFDLGSQTYCPDFYLPDDGAYWEVKGYYGPKSQTTIELFRAQHPEIPLVLLTEQPLLLLEQAARLRVAA